MEIAKHADIRSTQNAGKSHRHRHAFDCLAAEIRRNMDRLKKELIFQNDLRAGLSFYYCSSAMLIRSFHFTALGLKRETSGLLGA